MFRRKKKEIPKKPEPVPRCEMIPCRIGPCHWVMGNLCVVDAPIPVDGKCIQYREAIEK